jgi:predicted transcriptional regulator
MRRSRMEMYCDILGVLARGVPLKITQIIQKANLNGIVLKEGLAYLIGQKLVEKRMTVECRSVYAFYAITKTGTSVLGLLREINQVLPVIAKS